MNFVPLMMIIEFLCVAMIVDTDSVGVTIGVGDGVFICRDAEWKLNRKVNKAEGL
jgi:hypothetical protein